MIPLAVNGPCRFCGAEDWSLAADYDRPPPGETDFGLSPYRRSLWQCRACGHVINVHGMDLGALYSAAYWDRTYGEDRLTATYQKIMALPEERSDNRARADRVDTVWSSLTGTAGTGRLLDVGSGLAVFPAVMRERGWNCTAVDPDPRGTDHARRMAGVEAVCGDFMDVALDGSFDLISFNKVLEHVTDPAAMLEKAKTHLSPGGVCYVELPDGEAALHDSCDREEFFVEHYDAYSPASLALLARKAGFQVALLESVVEPSGKYTLRGFLIRPAAQG